jgi:hypothetical protein
MKSRSLKVSIMGCALLVIALSASARISAAGGSAVGVWKLNVQKSAYANMPAPKFEQLVVSTDNPDAIKWNIKEVTADGKSYISSYDGPVDGKDHPIMSMEAGSTVSYLRMGSGLRWTIKDKHGAVIETGASTLSADGDTLTLSGATQGATGNAKFRSVFEKVK